MISNQKRFNFILACDSYKVGHGDQLPKEIAKLHGNIVPRKPFGSIDKVVMMGGNVVSKILSYVRITDEDIDEAEIEITEQGYDFPRERWEAVRDLGYIPLRIRAIPDGTIVPVKVAVATVENTVDGFAWLESYVETWVQDIIWTMTTVASKLRPVKDLMEQFCEATGTPVEHAEYMVHNFGDRGAGGEDRAIMVAIAHGVFFSGTDCLRANRFIKHFYNTEKAYLSSVDASEHTTMCANSDLETKDDFGAFLMTLDMLRRAVKRAERGVGIPVVSGVIDTYDDERYCKEFIGKNYDKICEIGGKYVARPDSGNAIEKPFEVVDWLQFALYSNKFVTYESLQNEAGFKQLPENLGVLQGDGLRFDDLKQIVARALARNYAASCFSFGFGGGMTNGSGRDDLSFSMKATAKYVDGKWIDMQKAPKSDSGKISLCGRVTTYIDSEGNYFSDRVNLERINKNIKDCMVTVYEDGNDYIIDYEEVRKNARS